MASAIKWIGGLAAGSAVDTAVSKTTGKSLGEHVIDGVKKAFENDKKFFEETHKIALESKTYEPWMTEELDSGPQPCSIF